MNQPNIILDPKPEATKKPFLSNSMLQAWHKCPSAFYFQYIRKLDFPKGWGLGFGSAWDEALNAVTMGVRDGKAAGENLDEAMGLFNKRYDSEMSQSTWTENDLFTKAEKKKLEDANEGVIPEDKKIAQTQAKVAFWKQWGLSRLEAYNKIIVPQIRPIMVQQSFLIDFGDALPFGFKGTIDRIDEGGIIVDNKTSKSRWSDNDVKYDLQGVGYSLAYRIMNPGKVEERVQFDVLVKTTTQSFEEQFQQLVVGVQPHLIEMLLQELTRAYNEITTGQIRRSLNKFTMSCSWCEYEPDCWQPSVVWSRPPSEAEVNEWLAMDPANKEKMDQFILRETSRERLFNPQEVGTELAAICEHNPAFLQAWY